MSPSLRCVLVAGGALACVFASRAPAHAQQTACAEGQDIKIEIGTIDDPGNAASFDPFSTQELDEFFNLANCFCETPVALRLTLEGSATNFDQDPVELYFGTNCLQEDPTQRTECEPLTDFEGRPITFSDVRTLRTQTIVQFNPAQFITLAETGALSAGVFNLCPGFEATRDIYVRVRSPSDSADSFANSCQLSENLTDALVVDTVPPPEAANAVISPGENGALVEWDEPAENQDDLRSFQLLCQPVDGVFDPADDLPRDEPAFESPLEVCPELFSATGGVALGGEADAGPMPPDAAPMPTQPDAGVPLPEEPIDLLDPMTVCSGELGATTDSFRISGLRNGESYRVFLVSVDPALNPAAVDLGTITPRAVKDFWEDYKDAGGNADGGYCFVATATYGDYGHPYVRVLRDFRDESLASTAFGRWLIDRYYAYSPPLAGFIERHGAARWVARVLLFPVVAGAGLWVYSGALGKLGLFAALALAWSLRRMRKQRTQQRRPRSHRRRQLAIAAASATGMLLAWQSAASAQPYWDEVGGPAERQRLERESRSAWALDIKLGPYTPEIDEEFDVGPDGMGPYERMFGDDTQIMTQFELDRFFLYPYGQLGVGLGIGWFTTTARAFEVDSMGNVVVDDDGDPVRSSGDETTLRLIPTYLVGVYRFTALDERTKVPLVPYAKLGLSYYLWSIKRPDGGTATVPEDPTCMGEDCATDEAAGGSLGWQGTIGIAVRAERLDPSAAASLRNELGIEHAGFFAEVSMAQVDGFGSEDKLRVGDTTWSAGIVFEF